MIQPHKLFVEPYFGAGHVLFAKDPEDSSEIVNDLDRELTNFWDVIKDKDKFDEFKFLIALTPFSEIEYHRAKVFPEEPPARAVAFFIRNRMSRQALEQDYATPTRRLRSGMNEHVSAYLGAVDGLPILHERLQRVQIYNRPALELILQTDGPDTFFYLDPPYMEETRESVGQYKFEMTDSDHVRLLFVLSKIKGKFLLSGYPSAIYEDARQRYGWKSLTFDVPNHSSSSKKKETKSETVWYNY